MKLELTTLRLQDVSYARCFILTGLKRTTNIRPAHVRKSRDRAVDREPPLYLLGGGHVQLSPLLCHKFFTAGVLRYGLSGHRSGISDRTGTSIAACGLQPACENHRARRSGSRPVWVLHCAGRQDPVRVSPIRYDRGALPDKAQSMYTWRRPTVGPVLRPTWRN